MYEKSLDKFAALAKKYGLKDPAQIIEVGARDGRETLGFHHIFPSAKIMAFECNPDTLAVCKKNYEGIEEITLIEKAVTNKAGTISFYKTDPKSKEWNPGASSIFEAEKKYDMETYEQIKIEVPATTLADEMKSKNIKDLDLLWMDIQGAELLALEGAEDLLSRIKMIHMEVEFKPLYKNQPLFRNVRDFMDKNGFKLLTFTTIGKYAGDAVFVNSRYIKSSMPEWLTISFFISKERITGKIRNTPFLRSSLLHIKILIDNIVTYFKEKDSYASYQKEIRMVKEKKEVVLDISFGGLGDWLAFTSLPRLLQQSYDIKFYLSEESLSRVRNKDIYKLCFEMNPYFKGIKKSEGFAYHPFVCEKDLLNFLFDYDAPSVTEQLERQFGISDKGRPELYYEPRLIPELKNVILIDMNYISGKKLGWLYDETSFEREAKLHISEGTSIKEIDPTQQDLFTYLDMIYSCKYFITVLSGGAALAASLNKAFTAILPYNVYGTSVNQFVFKKSKGNYTR